MVSQSGSTVTWRTSHSRISLQRLHQTAHALEIMASPRAAAPAAAGETAATLQQEAEVLRQIIAELSVHLRSEALLAAISNRLLNMPLDDIEQGITGALEELGKSSAVQRAYVFLLSEDGGHLADAYEWTAEGVEGHDFDAFRGTPVTAFPWSMAQFRRGETVFVQDPDALPPEAAAERGACEALQILSYVNMPLFAGGKLIGWLGFDSVSEHRTWSEEEMRFMALAGDALANAIERRRREELIFRQRELNQRTRSMGTLAAGLAHEINNPLQFVVGNLSYAGDALEEAPGVLHEPEIEDLADAIAQAREGADRVRRIIGDLRALALGQDTEVEAVDLGAVIDATLRMASSQLRHKAEVVRDYQGVPAVRANASQLGQVLLNLVLNAARALPEGRAADNSVTISARAAGDQVELEVRDTGAGIAPELLPRVFDPFFTTREVGQGQGMGLAICYHLIRSFGGTIDIASEVDKGTSVRVTLPRADGAAAQGRRAGGAASTRRILMVDDEPLVLDLLGRVLKGHELVRASNGREALAELERDPRFDLVFCDVMMPDMTGQDVYERLREQSPGLEERIVFMSGGTFTREMSDFLESVPNLVLAKPFETRTIRRLLDELAPAGARS